MEETFVLLLKIVFSLNSLLEGTDVNGRKRERLESKGERWNFLV